MQILTLFWTPPNWLLNFSYWMMQPRVDDIFIDFLMYLIMVLLLPLCKGIIETD